MKIDENKISYLESIEIVEKKDENKLFYKDSCYKNNFIKYNNQIYYLKKCNPHRNMSHILNEIIGEYISKYFNLNTVHNILIRDKDKKYGVMTRNFIDNKDDYFYFDNSLFVNLENTPLVGLDNLNNLDYVFDKKSKQIQLDDNNLNIFIKNVKKLIVRDFITRQTDRHSENIIVRCIENKVYLMPIFDYEHSFCNDDYYTFYHIFDFNLLLDKVCYIIRHDYYFQELLIHAMKLDIKYIIDRIENDYSIKLDNKEKECYREVIERQQNKIKKYRLIR